MLDPVGEGDYLTLASDDDILEATRRALDSGT
jgi:hypothetical protein